MSKDKFSEEERTAIERKYQQHVQRHKASSCCSRCEGISDRDLEDLRFEKRLDRSAAIAYMKKMNGERE